MDPKFPRRMPNFSHGTAGIAYFLARVHEETNERKYLDAAIAGAKYLQAIAKTEGDICLITIVSHWFDELHARVKAK